MLPAAPADVVPVLTFVRYICYVSAFVPRIFFSPPSIFAFSYLNAMLLFIFFFSTFTFVFHGVCR